MRNKKKIIILIVIIFLMFIMIIPVKLIYQDGGSIGYKAFLYEVTIFHMMRINKEDIEGIQIKILGFEVYNNIKI